MIAGTHSGCGKTTITCGILAALVKRGLKVQPFKAGPDFIDPMFHTFLTGRSSRNLDSWLLDEKTLAGLFIRNSADADISVIEGVMGLYDGFGGESIIGSTAHIAKIIQSPVILVIDGAGMSLSIAALIKGFQQFDPEVPLAGIIINNISNESHYQLLREIITMHLNLPVLGYLPKQAEFALGSRHLGLIPSEEIADLQGRMNLLAAAVEKTINLDLLIQIAHHAGKLNNSWTLNEIPAQKTSVRIAVARDRAFNFYYADNLDLFHDLGAEVVFFSPLEDHQLPEKINGLYIGGGFPEVWAAQLQKNNSMRQSIHKKISEGLPTYAECGGLMYLSESITDNEGNLFTMVGIIPGKSQMTYSLQRFGYVEIEIQADNVIAKKGASIRGHEFHFSQTQVSATVPHCFRVRKTKNGQDLKEWDCGFQVHNMLAGYAHLHFWSNTGFAKEFLRQCRLYSQMSPSGIESNKRRIF
ncbi:MAG TPA: cobyrinate a,c-diamide synthase [Firmicutes bacterium]|nr:cobyrinate a,c-diamide synthase [Bacillota bacterium]